MKKYQIGVMGSAADLNYAKEVEELAKSIGKEIALSGNITVYGAEKDYDSLSTAAARGAKEGGGLTIGVTYGKGKDIFDKENTDIIISCGIERGGGREFVLVNSCDAVIAVGGGSGTLTELAIGYQSNIPLIVMKGTGGWADKLADSFIDDRKRVKCLSATSAKEAVSLALKEIKK